MLIFDAITDSIVARLQAANIAGGNVVKHRGQPTTEDDYPICNVSFGGDQAQAPDGGRNAVTHLEHTTTFSVDVIARANTGPELRVALAGFGEAIYDALLADRTWLDETEGEGIGGVRQAYDYPPDGNEFIGRISVQIDVLSRTIWEPTLPSDAGDLAEIELSTPATAPVIDVPTE